MSHDSYLDEFWRCSEIRPDGSFLSGIRRLGFGEHVFGPDTGLIGADAVAPLTQEIEIYNDDMGCIGVRPWVVSIQAIDLFRAGAGPYTPANERDIYQNGSRYSVLQAEVIWNDGTYEDRRLQVDIAGGITMHLYAQNVTVVALVPEGATTVNSRSTDIELAPGIGAFDSVVSCRITPSNREAMEGTVGYNFTRQVLNAGPVELVPIPAGAREVSIYQGTGAPVTTYEFGGSAAAGPKGIITADANGSVQNQPIPNVPYLRIPAGAGARFFSFVFKVFP